MESYSYLVSYYLRQYYTILFSQHEAPKQEKKQGKILSSDMINLS